MKRRSFLSIALASTLAPFFVKPIHAARASTVLSKGAHITRGINPTLFNTLHNAYWMGDDTVISDLNAGQNLATYGAIQAEYIHRIPFNTDGAKLAIVRVLPNFHGTFELLNEPDLGPYTPADAAALVAADIAVIDANCPGAYLILQLASQSHFVTYSPPLWNEIGKLGLQARINEISFHHYPTVQRDISGVFDPDATALETKKYTRGVVRPFMNQRGITYGSLTETGLDAGQVTKPEAALFVKSLWSVMQTFAWAKRLGWYDYMFNGLNYVPLSLVAQNQLNKVGQAWGLLQ